MKKYFHLIKQAVLSVLGRTTTFVAPAPVVDTTSPVLKEWYPTFCIPTLSEQVPVSEAEVPTLVVATPKVDECAAVVPVADVVVTPLLALEVPKPKRQPRKKKEILGVVAPLAVEAPEATKPKRTRRGGKKKE